MEDRRDHLHREIFDYLRSRDPLRLRFSASHRALGGLIDSERCRSGNFGRDTRLRRLLCALFQTSVRRFRHGPLPRAICWSFMEETPRRRFALVCCKGRSRLNPDADRRPSTRNLLLPNLLLEHRSSTQRSGPRLGSASLRSLFPDLLRHAGIARSRALPQ